MSKLLIVGAGGHGQVLADAASESGQWNDIAFLDDRYPMKPIFTYPVVGRMKEAKLFAETYTHAIIAIGSNTLRVGLLDEIEMLGFMIPTIIHPTAFVSKHAKLSKGTVVMAKAVVNVNCILGKGCIINTSATVDHDCIVGNGVHLSPGVHLAGDVKIGDHTWIGIGAVVINQVVIGSDVIIGAGSVVTKNTEDAVTLVGTPARVIKHHRG